MIFFKKLRLKISPLNFNIALSLDFNEGLNSGNYYNQIKKYLFLLIDENHLNNAIKIKEISDIKKFNNTAEAESFVKNKNIDLLIWGGFTNDNLRIDGEVINKINLKFTFRHQRT